MKRHKIILLIITALSLFISVNSYAQRLAVSTNAIGWATLSPNVSVDMAFSRHSSVAMEVSVAPWNVSDKFSVAHLTISPEYKYWFTMPFYGHYAGVNALYSSYNRVKDYQDKQGNIIAIGATYGYAFLINRKWNIVPNIGVGAGCNFTGGKREFIVVPTKVGINFQMVIK